MADPLDPLVVWLENIRKGDIPLVGGKCANLGELTAKGVRVPPGFAVTADAFRQAVVELRGADNRIVLGPSDDGGYYLIGMRKAYRRLFEDIVWSTARVFTQTLERARELTLSVRVLPKFYDIDDAMALRRLCGELLDGKSDDVAPATKEFVAGLVTRVGRERFCPPSVSS